MAVLTWLNILNNVSVLLVLFGGPSKSYAFQPVTNSRFFPEASMPTQPLKRIYTASRIKTKTSYTCTRPTIRSTRGTVTRLYSAAAILSTLDAVWQNFPYAAAAITCGVKASAADMVAQKRDYRKREEKEKAAAQAPSSGATTVGSTDLTASNLDGSATIVYDPNAASPIASAPKKTDWKRNLAFIVYGAVYQGMAQEFIYNHLYPVWFGSGSTPVIVLSKVLFDLLVQTTCITLPIAYLTKSLIYRYSAKEALRRYVDDIKHHGLLKKYFLLWGPVQCITFGLVPEHWRVTFIACVSFFWLIILSSIASKKPASATVPRGEQKEATQPVEECALEDGLTCNIDG